MSSLQAAHDSQAVPTGEKRFRWYVTNWWGHKVGATVYGNGVVVFHSPCGWPASSKMRVRSYSGVDEALAAAKEFKRDVQAVMAEIRNHGMRRDAVSVREVTQP